MGMDRTIADGLNIALNEADIVAVRFGSNDVPQAEVDLDVLAMSDSKDLPETQVTLVLTPVSRVVASLRMGNWDDADAEVVPLTLAGLPAAVASFGAQPIYGWEFFDADEPEWLDRLSLDVRFASAGDEHHTLELFQEGWGDRHLDLRIWFGEIAVHARDGGTVSLDKVIADCRRWWEAFFAGDRRTMTGRTLPGPPQPEPF
jgi:hypothetical protein